MKTRVSILFWFRRNKADAEASAAAAETFPALPTDKGFIMCRVTVRGRTASMSCNTRLTRGEWDAKAQRVKGSKQPAQLANMVLSKAREDLTNIWADLERQDKPVTAQGIMRLYKKGGHCNLSLLGLFKAFLAERKTLIGVEIKARTVVQNQTRYNKLEDFLNLERATDLRPEEFTPNMADKLLRWLMADVDYKRNSANNVIKTLGQVLRWGMRREMLEKNPLAHYKMKHTAPGKIKFLTADELDALSCLELADNGLGIARDCFIFQCWTGLAYADLAALNVRRDADYHKDKAGNVRRVLRITRAKSTVQKGYECVIPLMAEPERLLAHYGDTLPVPSNQYYNRQLKELGALAGIDAEKMTTHVGRKTAGTLLLNMGVPLPVVSKFLGHANTIITQKLYAELLDTTVVDAFSMLGNLGVVMPPQPTVYELPPAPLALRPAQRIQQKGGAAA